MKLADALRLWNTVRHLKPIQIRTRLTRRLRRAKPILDPAPVVCEPSGRWRGCHRGASMTGPCTFTFLNSERQLSTADDWNRTDWPKLWLYNAHYFDDLNSSTAAARSAWHQQLIERWIAENPPAFGNGWEPYPTSLRIVNWIKWSISGKPLSDPAIHSLAIQARWLKDNLETHLLGNHLWANAKAMFFAGTFFEGTLDDEEAAIWRNCGLDLIRQELDAQILPDGGHFERSPMYHAIVLEDLLDLIQLSKRYPMTVSSDDANTWRTTAAQMLRWLQIMSHPDGEVSFFNDTSLGIAPKLTDLRYYALRLGIALPNQRIQAIETLPESGYIRIQKDGAVLIADVGPIGPDHLPGHAHADTLSFELSIAAKHVVVNSGTSTYERDSERSRQRGTAAHNAVCVDGEDSSEVWAAFRVARRARTFDIRFGYQADLDIWWLEASHDGYQRLNSPVIHTRRWELHARRLKIIDQLSGTPKFSMARYHFEPSFREEPSDAAPQLCDGRHRIQWSVTGAGVTHLGASTWHPQFGKSIPNSVLTATFIGNRIETELTWSEVKATPLPTGNPQTAQAETSALTVA